MTFNREELKTKVLEMEKRWMAELKPITSFTPPFEKVLNELKPILLD